MNDPFSNYFNGENLLYSGLEKCFDIFVHSEIPERGHVSGVFNYSEFSILRNSGTVIWYFPLSSDFLIKCPSRFPTCCNFMSELAVNIVNSIKDTNYTFEQVRQTDNTSIFNSLIRRFRTLLTDNSL